MNEQLDSKKGLKNKSKIISHEIKGDRGVIIW
jgi:hypothetical protein